MASDATAAHRARVRRLTRMSATRVRSATPTGTRRAPQSGEPVDRPATTRREQRRVARGRGARRGGGAPGGAGPGQRAGHLPRRPAARASTPSRSASATRSRSGGVSMFVVLGLLVSLDQLTLNAVQTIEPELRQTFHISNGAVVFIASASSLFYALGAIPMGWLADRTQAHPDRRLRHAWPPRCSRSSPASPAARSCCSGCSA